MHHSHIDCFITCPLIIFSLRTKVAWIYWYYPWDWLGHDHLDELMLTCITSCILILIVLHLYVRCNILNRIGLKSCHTEGFIVWTHTVGGCMLSYSASNRIKIQSLWVCLYSINPSWQVLILPTCILCQWTCSCFLELQATAEFYTHTILRYTNVYLLLCYIVHVTNHVSLSLSLGGWAVEGLLHVNHDCIRI